MLQGMAVGVLKCNFADEFDRPLENGTDTFLKEMLKDPRYSASARRHGRNQIQHLSAGQAMQHHPRTKFAEDPMLSRQCSLRVAVKENASYASGKFQDDCGAGTAVDAHNYGSGFRPNRITRESPALAANKANFSLASSAYHAHGFLPHYEGAGRDRAASIHQQKSGQYSQKRPRVNLPASSSDAPQEHSGDGFNRRQSVDLTPRSAETRYIPTTFGYDGSEDPLPNDDGPGSKSKGKEKEQSSFDYEDVATTNFDQHHPKRDNECYRGAVNDYFRDLHKTEVRRMIARRRKDIMTAP